MNYYYIRVCDFFSFFLKKSPILLLFIKKNSQKSFLEYDQEG